MVINEPFEATSAAAHGLTACLTCGLLVALPKGAEEGACPRCASRVRLRQPASIQKAWAYLCAAYLLFVPANVWPIMKTGSLFGFQKDTILSGILFLWHSGSQGLALVVLVASILVPMFKLLSLTYLLISVQRHQNSRRRQRTRLYHVLEFIGRWSMLDIYVVTLLSVLVQLNELANIEPMPGALAFGGVVVFTLLATHEFDPRLIWDP